MENRRSYIASTLKRYMKENHITQRQLAEIMECSQPTIAEILNGNRTIGKKNAMKFHSAFGFNCDFLISGDGSLFPCNDNNITINRSGDYNLHDRSQMAQGNITNSSYDSALVRQMLDVMQKQQDHNERLIHLLESAMAKITNT